MDFNEQEIIRLASFPEQNPNPIVEMNCNTGQISYLNPAAKNYFPEISKTGMDHPLFNIVKHNIAPRKDFQCELTIDNRIFEQKIYFISNGKCIRIYSSDITQMKRSEALIREKNKDITDSINYAKKIQQSFLPSEKVLTDNYKDSFVLYKPKDIISGDFYWYNKISNYFLFACADCTGHGVPGALMSMIGTNFITNIVNEKGIIAPNEILFELDKKVRHALKQDEEHESKDGMDIAFCIIDKQNQVLHFSGANRPLLIIRKGELIEYAPNKLPVGGQHSQEKKFNEHIIPIESGDCIYLSSDGYADQFGGPEGKKLMKKNFYKLLTQIHSQPMIEQKYILDQTITEWKDGRDQLDDILVMGIRI